MCGLVAALATLSATRPLTLFGKLEERDGLEQSPANARSNGWAFPRTRAHPRRGDRRKYKHRQSTSRELARNLEQADADGNFGELAVFRAAPPQQSMRKTKRQKVHCRVRRRHQRRPRTCREDPPGFRCRASRGRRGSDELPEVPDSPGGINVYFADEPRTNGRLKAAGGDRQLTRPRTDHHVKHRAGPEHGPAQRRGAGVHRRHGPGWSRSTGAASSTGFYAPVDHPATFNKVKAGQTIPMKWRLGAPSVATTWEDYYRYDRESNAGHQTHPDERVRHAAC